VTVSNFIRSRATVGVNRILRLPRARPSLNIPDKRGQLIRRR
jgi:hypothetical protein